MHRSQLNSWVEAAHGTFRGALHPPFVIVRGLKNTEIPMNGYIKFSLPQYSAAIFRFLP